MISIITPVFNGQHFIEACIKLVIDQRCPAVEHIIVDGGSTDGTVEIIRRYASDYPHIRWVSKKDRGQSDAMNEGIAMARGQIMSFLNVDDYYEPNVLSRVADIFRGLPEPSLVVGNCNVWGSEGQLIVVNRPSKLRLSDLLLGPSINPMPLNPSAYFYHRSLHERAGLYNVDDHHTLDWDFLFRAVQYAHVRYIDETWGNFRMLEGTKTVIDIQAGNSSRRQVRLLKAYRKNLPLLQRLHVTLTYFVVNEVWGAVRYFRERPQELPWRFRARSKSIIERISRALPI